MQPVAITFEHEPDEQLSVVHEKPSLQLAHDPPPRPHEDDDVPVWHAKPSQQPVQHALAWHTPDAPPVPLHDAPSLHVGVTVRSASKRVVSVDAVDANT